MPRYPTLMQWLRKNGDFAAMYRQAKEDQADTLADQIIAIADEVAGETDNAKVQAARLRVDARKWTASKLKPKAYGERVEAAISGSIQHKTEPRSNYERAIAIISFLTEVERTGTAEQVANLKRSLPPGLSGLLSG